MKSLKSDIEPEKLQFLAETNVGGGVSLQKDLQVTEPSVPLERAYPRANLGDSGTKILHGIITEEYNPQLQGIQGINVYDEMRKSDGTVQAALRACKLPIRRADWFIKEVSDSPEHVAQAEFVRHALFDWIEDITWDDIVRQALLMEDFGVMLFEKVYGTYEFEGKTYITLKKLAPRLPKSILMWELTDSTFGIQQIRQDGILAQIPGSKLLIFVNEREGDNWWGTSMLRSAYQHWYHKSKYYAIDGIGFERQALGVPYAKMPIGYTENDEKKAESVLANLRANEKSFLVYPNTYEIGFMDMGAKTTRDPQTAIEHHNKQILQSVLAQFLELGQTKSNSGSRALSSDHSDLFLKSMEALANTFVSVINRDCIRELVDLNFDNVEDYPVLDYTGIVKADVASLGQAYSQLVTAGALNPTDGDQAYLRSLLGLPARTQEEIEEAANDEEDEETLEETGVEVDDDADSGNSDANDEDDVDDAVTTTTAKKAAKKTTAPKKPVKKAPKGGTDKPSKPAKPAPAAASEHTHLNLKRTFAIAEGFMSWRPLTMSETKVDWGKMQQMMDSLEEDFKGPAGELLTKTKDDFMTQVYALLQTGDTSGLAALTLDFEKKYKDILATAMKQAHAYGRSSATQELGYGARPGASADDLASIEMISSTIAAKTAADIEATAKIAVAAALRSNKPALQAAGEIDKDVQDAIDKAIDDTSNILVGQGINNGRNSVFERNSDDIQSLQRSEILDNKTCNFCLSMDGRVVAPDDDWGMTDIFHSNCRGLWVATLNEEVNPPAIEGIPDNVSNYYGGKTNDLIQPKQAIPKPGGLAERYIKQKEAGKQ